MNKLYYLLQNLLKFWILPLLLFPTTIWSQGPEFIKIVGDAAHVARPEQGCNTSAQDTCQQLTKNLPHQVGGAWMEDDFIDLLLDFDFELCLYLGDQDIGGDGVVFTLHADPRGAAALGTDLGIRGISPSFGVEIDTRQNAGQGDEDLPLDHLAILKDGDLENPIVGPVTAISQDVLHQDTLADHPHFNIEDGEVHRLRVRWDASRQYLEVYFDDRLRMTWQGDLINEFLDGKRFVYGGFTGSTGPQGQAQTVCLDQYCFAQCPPIIDCDVPRFPFWNQLNHPDFGRWVPSPIGDVVMHEINSKGPTFFVTPYDLIDVEILFNIQVLPNGDDDYWGFVFGYQAPFGLDPIYHKMYLFDWRWANPVDNPAYPSYANREGYALSRIDGPIPDSTARRKYFDRHDEDSTLQILAKDWGLGKGWQVGATYEFRLIYTKSSIEIYLDEQLIYQQEGACFEPGKFGFYNLSQPYINYWVKDINYLPSFELSEEEICLGENIEVTFYDANCSEYIDLDLVKSMTWDFGDGTVVDIEKPRPYNVNRIHQYQAPGTYTLSLEARAEPGGCSKKISKTITVHPNPKFRLGPDTTLCEGARLDLSVDTDGGHCQWNTGDTNCALSITQAGHYSLILTENGCATEDHIEVDYSIIDYQVDWTGPCPDERDGEIKVNGDPAFTYTLSQDSFLQDFYGLEAGSYWLEVSDTFACQKWEEIVLETHPRLEYDFDWTDISCHGAADGLVNIDFWDNTYGLIGLAGQPLSQRTHIDNLAAGRYQLTIQDPLTKCYYEEPFDIAEPPPLQLELPKDTTIQLGCALAIISKVNHPGQLNYKWERDSFINCLSCPHVIVQPLETTTYALTVSNGANCSASDHITVEVDKNYGISLPNVFTPNGDNINDVLMIISKRSIKRVRNISLFQVFNRWGELQFEARNFLPDDAQYGWDGHFNNRRANRGVYIYRIEVEYIDGYKSAIQGDVTLMY
ncbi:MAG: gliding motility-associated C-terminal domain-containing protein [Bacteroidota bacterium]